MPQGESSHARTRPRGHLIHYLALLALGALALAGLVSACRDAGEPRQASAPSKIYARQGGQPEPGVSWNQPVPFSHQWHAGALAVDCRYCHTTVETSAFAGIPATEICMNCHAFILTDDPNLAPVRDSYESGEPIVWTRVNDLADFSYFNHGDHIYNGVGCVTCHGQVAQTVVLEQTESLSMRWCLDCHRRPEQYVRPRQFVFVADWEPSPDQLTVGRQIVEEYDIERKTSCSICHR